MTSNLCTQHLNSLFAGMSLLSLITPIRLDRLLLFKKGWWHEVGSEGQNSMGEEKDDDDG